MTRICAIGNSHLAALMLGWQGIAKEYPGVEISFFAARGDLLGDLAVHKGRLVPRSRQLRRALKKTHERPRINGIYDAYLLGGLDFSLLWVASICKNFRSEAHKRDARIPLSDRCFARLLRDKLRESLAMKTATKLREITSAPIFLIPEPFPAAGGAGVKIVAGIEANGDDKSFASLFEQACFEAAGDLNLTLVMQPEFTRSTPLRTNCELSRGSTKLTGGLAVAHREGESLHMNESYGSIMLRQAFDAGLGNASADAPNANPQKMSTEVGVGSPTGLAHDEKRSVHRAAANHEL